MVASKKARVVPLTATAKKGRGKKDQLVENIHSAVKNYRGVYAFQFDNMRSQILKDIRREHQDDSRFFLGSNRVMAVALGKTQEDSYAPNLHKLTSFLKGSAGLFFTNLEKKTVKKLFNETYVVRDYARSGAQSSTDIKVPKGALDASKFPHSMLEQLTALGLPARLVKGQIVLESDFTICEKDQPLTSAQCQLLKLFDHKVAEFRITLTAHWENGVARKIKA